MTSPSITLTARISSSALDSRRGVVRLHPEVMDALNLRAWDAVQLTGARNTVALAATTASRTNGASTVPGVLWTDELVLTNLGLTDGAEVSVRVVHPQPATSVTVAGSRLARAAVAPETVRLALTGKVFRSGDAVSLLPQDLARDTSGDASAVRRRLSAAIGVTWTNELLTITATRPDGPVTMRPSTVVSWRDAEERDAAEAAALPATEAPAVTPVEGSTPSSAPVSVTDLVGAREAADRLTEWLELTFDHPDLLRRLGAGTHLGVLVTGPDGAGKATLARAVGGSCGAEVVELAAPTVAALQPADASARVHDAIRRATRADTNRALLVVTDIEALLPAADPPPLATLVLDALRTAVAAPGVAVVVTSSRPEAVDPRLRAPDLVDREVAIPLPDARTRTELLRVLLRDTPLEHTVELGEVASRTPGFVAADLLALRREAAIRAALRHQSGREPHAEPNTEPTVGQQDLLDALATVRPLSMSTSETVPTGELTLDEVGDMTKVKQALTETVLWPLRYPDSFARLGVQPSRGVLLYGPPGCGKTFLVRALAESGQLNVFSVKGAELLDKWVGESERAVRELFTRATNAAPALVFLDEVDALAPRRGQSADSGVADRVVAALLTELDGVGPRRDVVVLGATNRPELVDPALLRPGRLERSVSVPPPDVAARTEVLRSAARNTPLASDVDLRALAAGLEGYSAADCAAVIREAALTAMRESLEAGEITAAHLDAARTTVRPSLDADQLAAHSAYAPGG